MRTRSNSIVRLDWYHRLVTRTILDFQDPVTGLLPSRIKWNAQNHLQSKYQGDAWVRDNVYSIIAVWALALAYRKNADMDEDRAKAYELTQAVVKCMRGLLTSMMRQADKVERFKTSQSRADCLHAKYSMKTGGTCVSDHGWGHLQIDATSLYLLQLAQMTASGIQLIFTLDEVAFIQNLVFYIEKAYSVPDYGIWERGDKLNHGMPELNASSIGLAKAALESLNGMDLFGPGGSQFSVIHVLPDDIQQCKAILQSMLPRESNSKEIAGSLLSVISYPAFAVEDEDLVNETRDEIISKLQGRYGLCRFLRDGYKTPVEDPFRLHYEPAELEIFEHIECEWPLFFVYLILDGIFMDKPDQVKKYTTLLEPLLIKDETGLVLMPELFFVPRDKVSEEKANPHSVDRMGGEYAPHMWSQSLYIVACLLQEKFVAMGELDPLNRRQSTESRPDVVVQVALLAEDDNVRAQLSLLEVPVQVVRQVHPIQVLPAHVLSTTYQQLGKNGKLEMTGRPYYNIGVLGTSTLYRIGNALFTFTPQFLDYHQFYLCLDNEFLADRFKSLVGFLGANWRSLGRPILTLVVTTAMMEESISSCIGNLILKLKGGYLSGVRVRLGYLSDFLSTSCISMLHFVRDYSETDLRMLRQSGFTGRDLLKRSDSRGRSNTITSGTSPKTSNLTGSIKRSRSVSIYCDRDTMMSPWLSSTRGLRLRSWSDVSTEAESDASSTSSIAIPGRNLSRSPSPTRTASPKASLEERLSNGWSPSRSRALSIDLETKEYVKQLEDATDINEQADILHFLYSTKGAKFDTNLYDVPETTVEKLLEELYEKACEVKLWSLVRHTAGLLHKQVEDLSEACTDILVHQKQITVGIPQDGHEEVITRPLPPTELKNIIYSVFGEDMSTGVVTQELLVYLGIFVRTEPSMFKEMLRLRVGLIIEVMVAELARSLTCTGEDAAEYFMNLSPFEMKTLLYHILSGKEFGITDEKPQNTYIACNYLHFIAKNVTCRIRFGSVRTLSEKQLSIINIDLPKRVGIKKLSNAIKNLSGRSMHRQHGQPDLLHLTQTAEPQHEEEVSPTRDERIGTWIRRRCLDGALNRVPEDFYARVWKILEKCHQVSIYKHILPSAMVREMTPGELKFALCVESALNRIPEPEYRQLVVEVLMVLALVVISYPQQSLWDTVDVDELVLEGHQAYLTEQMAIGGNSVLCCARPINDRVGCGGANGICRFFYDTAPSGRYGTMTYFSKAVAKKLSFIPHQNDCIIS